MIETESTTVQGRWGYYPCDYETYRKLKKLFGFYLKSKRMDAAHERWARKQPQNRIQRERVYDAQGRCCGKHPVLDASGNPIRLAEPPRMKVPISHFVEDDYRSARYPKGSPQEVKPLKLTMSAIDQQLSLCENLAK